MKLNIDALLAKNPQVDREYIENRLKEMQRPSSPKQKNAPGVLSPYGSRKRATPGESGWRETCRQRSPKR